MSNCQPNVMSVTNVGYRDGGGKKNTLSIELICFARWQPYGRWLSFFLARESPCSPKNCVSVSQRINKERKSDSRRAQDELVIT